MTNDEYLACLDRIRDLPLEQQIPASFVLFGERTADLIAPVRADLVLLTQTLHQVANAAMQTYESVERLHTELHGAISRINSLEERVAALEAWRRRLSVTDDR